MAVASRPTPAAKGHVALARTTEVVSGSLEGPLAWLTEANSGRHVYPSSSGSLRRSGQIALLPTWLIQMLGRQVATDPQPVP